MLGIVLFSVIGKLKNLEVLPLLRLKKDDPNHFLKKHEKNRIYVILIMTLVSVLLRL